LRCGGHLANVGVVVRKAHLKAYRPEHWGDMSTLNVNGGDNTENMTIELAKNAMNWTIKIAASKSRGPQKCGASSNQEGSAAQFTSIWVVSPKRESNSLARV
jgi:hypothetical protein